MKIGVVIVTYNSNFTLEPQKIDDYHYFIGYFTEENGKGTQFDSDLATSFIEILKLHTDDITKILAQNQ